MYILCLFPANHHMYTCLMFSTLYYADFQVALDLQWDYCSGLLTLLCTHSISDNNPFWIYNGTAVGGLALDSIPGAEYTEATSTRHVAVIRGIEKVKALDSFTFQCVYHRLNRAVKSNKEQYYWGKLTLTHRITRKKLVWLASPSTPRRVWFHPCNVF